MKCECELDQLELVVNPCQLHARWNKDVMEKALTVYTVQLILTCPSCKARHIDEGEFATKVHHTHACQSCGMVWRPAIEPTVVVQFLPGFKNK